MQKAKFAGIFIVFVIVLLFNTNIAYSTSGFNAKSVALEFLEQVAGINMSTYTIVSFNVSRNRMTDSQHFQTNVRIVINDGKREFVTLITFVDNKFWAYNLELLSGNLGVSEQSLNDSLTLVNRTVNGYKKYFNRSYCTKFAQMVSTALQTQSCKVEDEETMLEIQQAENGFTSLEYTKLQWFQKINDQLVSSFRSVAISLSKTGLLTRLTDNIGIYSVATTDINISKEKAIEIAMPYVEAYAYKYQQEIKTVNATLEYVRDIASNRGDSFAIYPQWNVLAIFDKTNEDNVSGYAALIWADNGAVYHHDPQGFFVSSGGDPLYLLWPFILAVTAIFVVLFSLGVCKQRQARIRRVMR